MFKKIVISILGLVVILIGISAALPFIYKDEIFKMVKNEANNYLNATLDFGTFNMTIFKSFPDLTLRIDNVVVDGIDQFEGVRLADITTFEVTLDVISVIKGGTISVKSFGLVKPKLHVVVLKDGKANYDITKPSDTPEAETTSSDEATSFHVALQHYYLENASIIYDDKEGDMYAQLTNLTHTGNGDFTEDIFILKTQTSIDELTYKMEGLAYLNKVRITAKFDMDMDMPNSKYTFKENEITLNALGLGFDGWVAMPTDDITMDLKYHANQTEFKNILSLVPAIYAKDFESVKTAGKLALDGYAKGVYNDKQLPAFGFNLLVQDAMFQYPDLPKSADNIQIAVDISNPGGNEDLTVVNISKFHVELGGNPIDMKMRVTTPVSDATIDGAIKAQINLGMIKDVMPVEDGESYSGSVTADVTMKGRMSTIEREEYDQFDAQGRVIILDMDYKSKDVPYGVKIKKAYLDFSPKYLDLSSFEAMIGTSDISAKGKIGNYMAYYFKNDALNGSFDMFSNKMDLNELMGEEESEETSLTSTADSVSEVMTVIEVPANIKFNMTAKMNKLLYDNMEMTNVMGALEVSEQQVKIQEFVMTILDGKMSMNGTYNTTNPKIPTANFIVDIQQFDLQKTFKTFNTVQKMAPIIENSKGKFSTSLSFFTLLDEKMEPVLTSLNGKGNLTTHGVEIENSGALGKLADQLKMNDFKKLSLDNVNISYKFKDGKVEVEPFEFKTGQISSTVSGYNSFDETINYVMSMKIPSSYVSGAASALTSMLGSFGGKIPEYVNADVLITGTVTDPKIKIGLKNTVGSATENVKEMAKEEFEKAKVKVEEKIQEVKEDVTARIQAETEKIRREAQAAAQKLKDEAMSAASLTKKEGYSGADKVESEAKNPIAKVAAKEAAKKLRSGADKKAQDIIDEANKRADQILRDAETKISQLK